MKAIQITEFGGPEVMKYQDVADPTPGESEAVRMERSSSSSRCSWMAADRAFKSWPRAAKPSARRAGPPVSRA